MFATACSGRSATSRQRHPLVQEQEKYTLSGQKLMDGFV
jgi:hypothetical protein